MPFKNESLSKDSFDALFKYFQNKRNVIILGDFNTRSKVDDTCLTKQCNVLFKKNADNPTQQLENTLNLCKKPENDAETTYCNTLQKKLIDSDYLTQYLENKVNKPANEASLAQYLNQPNNVPEHINRNDYVEGTITFLPSYKINDGMYSLKKDRKHRLAGYADRILVKGVRIVENSYKLCNCKGNDHYPVMLDIEAMPMNGGTRKKRNRKTKTKRRY